MQQQLPILRSIYLKNSLIELKDEFDPSIPGQLLGARFKTDPELKFTVKELEATNPDKIKVELCEYTIHFEFRYSLLDKNESQNEDAQIIAAIINADFVAVYFCDKTNTIDWQGFGNNVLMHTWPYWREYCHDSMSRMNLPVSMIPLAVWNHVPADTQNPTEGQSEIKDSEPAKSANKTPTGKKRVAAKR